MINRQAQKKRHQAAGFTLIEVLVALVVMTVGMLGVAVLYVDGIRINRTALYRTTAVALAADMAERIRANQNADYTGTRPGADGGCGIAPGCTPDELANDDWFRWRLLLDDYLPTGYTPLIVRQQAGAGNRMSRFDITLQWPEVGRDIPVSYTLSVQL